MQTLSKTFLGTAPAEKTTPADARQAQRAHWECQLAGRPHMFGAEASAPAAHMAHLLKDMQERRAAGEMPELLELGAGQGRDTLYFASQGVRVLALDYAEAGIRAVEAAWHADLVSGNGESGESGTGTRAARGHVRALQHDVRQPLPLEAHSVDACYAHMLLCMALTMNELRALCTEVRRVLRPGGIFMYTVRHEDDAHYGAGRHGGENMYETWGFMVHFFNRGMVTALAEGFSLLDVHSFEEGALPRKLWRVTMKKPDSATGANTLA